MVNNICSAHSVASSFLAELRDVEVQSDRARFRANMERMGEIFAYEISKTFHYRAVETETSLGTAVSHVMDAEIVLLTILRAGLPLHRGMLNYFGDVQNGFVATQRHHHKDGSFDIGVDYLNCPELDDKVLIICDPMLATGSSMVSTLEALEELGQPAHVHLVAIIASTYGIRYVNRECPEADIWIAAEDEELTAKSYIVPGLGDAGDLAYGHKTEE
jgi:uracil phosphoribosyltransferase